MKGEQTDNLSTSQRLDVSRNSYGDNPINAINRLKSINDNIEMMKNRYLVLRRRDEHNKYKTLDQQKRLNLHHIIHDRLKNEREQLRRSLEEIRDTKQVKERSQTIRKQMQEGIASARQQLMNSNLQKYEQISEEALKHQETIDLNKQADLSKNRSKALSLKKLQQQEKQVIEMKLKNKRQSILNSKNVESKEIKQKSAQGEKILEKLEKNQVQMIREASKSMQNSRLMSEKFTEIMMNMPSYKNKKGDKSERASFLPTIKQRNPNSSTLQVVIV